MKIAFCRNNAWKDSGQKGAGFPPAREQRSEYSFAGQQNIHSIALENSSQNIAFCIAIGYDFSCVNASCFFSVAGTDALFQVGEMKIRAQKIFRFQRERDKRPENAGCGLIFAHIVKPLSNALSAFSFSCENTSDPVSFRRQGRFGVAHCRPAFHTARRQRPRGFCPEERERHAGALTAQRTQRAAFRVAKCVMTACSREYSTGEETSLSEGLGHPRPADPRSACRRRRCGPAGNYGIRVNAPVVQTLLLLASAVAAWMVGRKSGTLRQSRKFTNFLLSAKYVQIIRAAVSVRRLATDDN
jgi:hypothetical protein